MITTADQYNAYLAVVKNANHPPVYAALPNANNIYNIDIKTREIDAPLFLGVEKDNISETIYFIIDRYADYMDLSQTSCIITYKNAKKETRVYVVPFYDIYTYAHVSKMIIPWNLDFGVMEQAGTVEFAIQFFKTVDKFNRHTQQMETDIVYSLNTQVASSTVLSGINVTELGEQYKLTNTEFDMLVQEITDIKGQIFERWPSWTILD